MSSLIRGYKYDIFISYRQNDNRSGWVTEFVAALNAELAASIKEPVSVYFDSNPHDGLLETHSVGKSLEGKLKCLIFIPILSQTYCDPKSFAWQHEFCAFNELAQADKLGRDIKLKNGNVASRLLPVIIHELDTADKEIIEDQLGSVVRGIDFIFSAPGVDRPLKAAEEDAKANLNRTFYGDQVNKVARAVKELIEGMKVVSSPTTGQSDFVRQLTAIIEENIANEQFGVSDLADKTNMSRSNLLRKVKKETNLSVSQLISQVRLKRGMELLRAEKLNVSEVSHQVGFSSTSYFIKCFREYYGYPPGEVGKMDHQKEESIPGNLPITENGNAKRNLIIIGSVLLIVALLAFLFLYKKVPSALTPALEKSIAVLPFKNDSNDSSNIYLINGLMESTLIKLQQIKDLRVLSRTSTEKYRHAARSIPEMADELNVSYFVEGSGQKIGDQIVLNIQLIDGPNDKHLWAKQYRRETKDIFALQQEIAKDVAEEIKAIITPEEAERLEKIPTENMEAYDYFLKGRELLSYRTNLESAIEFFNKAIELDNKFALAYADAVIAYYYLDIFKAEKKYTAEIGSYSDKALLYDPKNAECLMAKAIYYMQINEYELATPYLERGLEYNPNSSEIIAVLADLYGGYLPNTSKYLEYALRGLQLSIGSTDSITTSYTYLRLSNAFAQSGFTDEALKYIDKSLVYNPENPFSRHLKAFILYAKNGDLPHTRELLIEEFKKDSTRFDILQDIGKVSYYLGDYEGAYQYYKEFVAIREYGNLDVYVHENLLIGDVFLKASQKEKAEEFVESYKRYIDNENSIYKSLGLASYYAYRHDTKKVVEYMKLAAKEENYMYWLILFYDKDPILESVMAIPEVKQSLEEIKKKFWENHNKIKVTLEEKGLLQ